MFKIEKECSFVKLSIPGATHQFTKRIRCEIDLRLRTRTLHAIVVHPKALITWLETAIHLPLTVLTISLLLWVVVNWLGNLAWELELHIREGRLEVTIAILQVWLLSGLRRLFLLSSDLIHINSHLLPSKHVHLLIRNNSHWVDVWGHSSIRLLNLRIIHGSWLIGTKINGI